MPPRVEPSSPRPPSADLRARAPAAPAHYRRHLDSYEGQDIPRLLTLLLYLTWEPREGGHLRVYPPADPAAPREIEPRPGRLVVFYSQEVEHEVLPSVGDRHALTVWVWDTKRDRHGR